MYNEEYADKINGKKNREDGTESEIDDNENT